MPNVLDVLIVGAGPYGLSLASHLRASGVRFRIFGAVMGFWKSSTPPGMKMKSHAWASCLSDPAGQFTLSAYWAERGVAIANAETPTLEQFVQYAEAFQRRFVPDVEPNMVTRLTRADDLFLATLDDGETVVARRVVIAVGVGAFSYIPEAFAGLPAEAISHSVEYGPLDGLKGKTIAVVGAGASATDLAAVLHESGLAVSLVARAKEVRFAQKPRPRKLWRRWAASWVKPLIRPGSGIGPGWLLKICADAPWIFHALPLQSRRRIVANQLGPLGHSDFRDRVIGRLPLRLGCKVKSAEWSGRKVNLRLLRGGAEEAVSVDHVIAATGYKIELSRLGFLDEALLRDISVAAGAPVLSINYETSVSGLHFIGPVAAESFGPVMRFAFGASHPARRLSACFAKSAAPRDASRTLSVANAQSRGHDG